MNNTTKIVITAIALVLIVLSAGVYIFTRNKSIDIAEPSPQAATSLEESSSSSAAEPIYTPGTSSYEARFGIFSQALASQKAENAKPEKPPVLPDEKIITKNPDGTTNTEIQRPEYSKPEPPPPPVIDEEQASDPTKEPEYTPEQKEPNKPKPDDPETPTGGETNNKGQIFVPGFGWMEDPGNGSGHGEIAEDMNPNGNIIGY